MDIEYLLVLQQLRESLPEFVEQLFTLLSAAANGPVLVVVVLVLYWCFDKRMAQTAMLAFATGICACHTLKSAACIYRPWVRSSAIVPAPGALAGAGGYSFPSGHVTSTATVLGSIGWLARTKRLWVSVLCAVLIALVMFSRNFLGVHTPQDVVTALLISLCAIAVVQLFLNWIDSCDRTAPGHNKDLVVVIAVLIVAGIATAYIALKPYPLDYVNGALLVDPVETQVNALQGPGILAGVALGWLLERRFVGFATEQLNAKVRGTRIGIGIVCCVAAYLVCSIVLKLLLPHNWAKFFIALICAPVAIFVVPYAFSSFERRRPAA